MALLRSGLIARGTNTPSLLRNRLLRPVASGAAPEVRATITWAAVIAAASSTTNADTYATASINPTSDRPVYAALANAVTAGTSSTPTCTGAGLTWVQVNTVAIGTRRLTVFRAQGTVVAGALTFDLGAASGNQSAVWAVVQPAGANTSGTNGSGATVQSITTSGATITTLTNTLAALENAANHHLAFTMLATAAAVTPDADFTPLSADTEASSAIALDVSYALNQTVCTPTWSSATAAMVSVEVKAAVV